MQRGQGITTLLWEYPVRLKVIYSRNLRVVLPLSIALISAAFIGTACRTIPQEWVAHPEPELSAQDLNRARALALYSYGMLVDTGFASTNQTTLTREELLNRATTLDPAAQPPLASLLNLLNQEMRFSDALDAAERYLEYNPDDRAIRVDAATLADAAGQYTSAARHVATLLETDPKNRELHEALVKLYFHCTNTTAAVQQLRHYHTQFNDEESASLPIHWAVYHIEHNPPNPGEALECTHIALEFATNTLKQAALTALSGECLLLLNQTNNAAHAWLSAFNMDPTTLTPILRLGGLQAVLKQPLQLPIPPDDTRTIALLEAATRQASDNPRGAMQRLEEYHHTNKSHSPPLSEDIYGWLAMLYERFNHHDKFDKIMLEAINHHPDSDNLKNTLAYTWAERNTNLQQALNLSNQALKTKPRSEAYLDTKGWILFKLGRPHEALQLLLSAAEINTSEPEILDHIGEVLLALGYESEAIDIWQRSYSFNPDNNIAAKLTKLGAKPNSPTNEN